MAYKGRQATAQGYEHVHLRNRSQTSVYHHENKTKLRKEERKISEPAGVHGQTNDLTVYSRLKHDTTPPPAIAQDLSVYSRLKHDTIPPPVTAQDLAGYSQLGYDTAQLDTNPAVDKGSKLHLSPKPIPRRRSTFSAFKQDKQMHDDLYETPVHSATQHPPHLRTASSQHNVSQKKPPPNVQTKQPEHTYDTIDESEPVLVPGKIVALPRSSTQLQKSTEQDPISDKIAPHAFIKSRDNTHIKDKRTQSE